MNINDFVKQTSEQKEASERNRIQQEFFDKLDAANREAVNPILEKVKKLLRLATSSNINESASAAAKAQELIDRYNITYENKEQITHVVLSDTDGAEKKSTWKGRLANIVSHNNGCFIYWNRDNTLEIVGKTQDILTSKYLYEYLRSEIDHLTKKYLSIVEAGRGIAKSLGLNFRFGCCDTISERLTAQREATIQHMREEATRANALLVLDKQLAIFNAKMDETMKYIRAHMRFGNPVQSHSRYNEEARQAGREAAKNIHLSGSKSLNSQKMLGV